MTGAEVFAAVGLERGDEVAFRSAADPGVTHRAKIIRVTPAASKQLDNTAYTVASGGEVTITPPTGEASARYILVEAANAMHFISNSFGDSVRQSNSPSHRYRPSRLDLTGCRAAWR